MTLEDQLQIVLDVLYCLKYVTFLSSCRHASLQELIAEQTDIRSSHQALYFDGDLLQVEAFQPVKNYPRTTKSKPLILLSTNVTDFQSIHIPHTCKLPSLILKIFMITDIDVGLLDCWWCRLQSTMSTGRMNPITTV